jgi:uncharacterized membrane protein
VLHIHLQQLHMFGLYCTLALYCIIFASSHVDVDTEEYIAYILQMESYTFRSFRSTWPHSCSISIENETAECYTFRLASFKTIFVVHLRHTL